MTRYYFDIHDGIEAEDREGTDLDSVEAARAHAMQVAAAYAGKPLPASDDGGAIVVDVRGAKGARLMSVRLVFSVEAA